MSVINVEFFGYFFAGWFKNGTGDISDAYYLEITPIGWAFSIWGIIYTWLLIGIIFILITICRQNHAGAVYLNPPVITKVFLVLYTLDMILNITWLFMWDRQFMPWAFVVFLAYDFVLYAMLFNHHRLVDHYLKHMQENHRWVNDYSLHVIELIQYNIKWPI